MERLKNHSGKPSMLVLRPADADETTVAWYMALKNNDTPTGLLLSRQNIPTLQPKESSRQLYYTKLMQNAQRKISPPRKTQIRGRDTTIPWLSYLSGNFPGA